MQSVVTGGNVKVLAKAIHSLSRIGDDLYVEPQADGLALRSVNSSRSAYACFLFAPLFFSRYSTNNGLNFRCKIAIKSVQAVFKSLATLEKTVEKCHIVLNEERDRLTFTLHCKHGLLKTHNLSYQDSESLQAVFDKDSYANIVRAHPRVLTDTVAHFPMSLEEVTVTVSDERMWVKNHVEDETERSKAMLTELCLASDEFDDFMVKAPNSFTFCLKELRGMLVFAESTGLPVSMYFDEPGSPVVLSVTDSVLEGNFVLATLSDDYNPQKNKSKGARAQPSPPPDDFMNDDMDSYIIAMDTSVAPDHMATATAAVAAAAVGPPVGEPTNSRQAATAKHKIPKEQEEDEEEETVDDLEKPPNKKFRSLFFGSVLPASPQRSSQPLTNQEVLASDSEDET